MLEQSFPFSDESADLHNLMADVEFQAERMKSETARLESEKRQLEATARQHGIQLKQAQKQFATVQNMQPQANDALGRTVDDDQHHARKMQQVRALF